MIIADFTRDIIPILALNVSAMCFLPILINDVQGLLHRFGFAAMLADKLTLLSLQQFSILYALRNVTMLKATGRFDFIGTALIVGALSAMSIGLGANVDLSSTAASIEDLRPLPAYAPQLLTIVAILFAGFMLVESRIKDPLVNLKMFKRRNLWTASIVNLLILYCLFIGLVSVPLLVNIRQESIETLSQAALQVGVLLSTLTLPMAAVWCICHEIKSRISSTILLTETSSLA